jgi:hypothetical protein
LIKNNLEVDKLELVLEFILKTNRNLIFFYILPRKALIKRMLCVIDIRAFLYLQIFTNSGQHFGLNGTRELPQSNHWISDKIIK